jgi:hypothetical protein
MGQTIGITLSSLSSKLFSFSYFLERKFFVGSAHFVWEGWHWSNWKTRQVHLNLFSLFVIVHPGIFFSTFTHGDVRDH